MYTPCFLRQHASTEQTSVFLAKRIGLRTDASGKFEKGLDPNNAKAAIDRACQLMEELGAGEVVGGMVDIMQRDKRTCPEYRLSRSASTHFSEQTLQKKKCLHTLQK